MSHCFVVGVECTPRHWVGHCNVYNGWIGIEQLHEKKNDYELRPTFLRIFIIHIFIYFIIWWTNDLS